MTKSPQTIKIIAEVIFMFNDFYGTYKNARDASWKFLIDYHVDRLPVDLKSITDALGIRVRADNTNILNPHQRGTTMTDNDKTYIIVREGGTPAENRYTIMHELGHAYLGHPMVDGKYFRTFDINDSNEYEAERFAIDVLAPACVLWGLNLHTAKDISEACNISMTAAQRRAERMEVLYKRNMFLSHPLERQVFEQFRAFINSR